MNIDFVFRIAAFGLVISVLNQVLTRAGREDIATLATLSGLAVVLLMVVKQMADFFTSVKTMFSLF